MSEVSPFLETYTLPLTLVIDVQEVAVFYREYVAEVNELAGDDRLNPESDDVGYRTGKPTPFVEWLHEWADSLRDEVTELGGPTWSIARGPRRRKR